MTLRSRLTAAFFAISVVPLSAVTLFSYVSSERALRHAAEQQANALADELGHRMQWVTADIERRISRAWPPAAPLPPSMRAEAGGPRRSGEAASDGPLAPAGRPALARPMPSSGSPAASAGQVSGGLAVVFGEMAPLVEALEFTPALPKVPAAPTIGPAGPEAPMPPRAERDSGPRPRPASPPPVVTDRMAGEAAVVITEAMKQYQAGKVPASPGEIAAWTEKLQQQIRLGLAQLPPGQRGARAGGGRPPAARSDTPGANSAQGPSSRMQSVTVWRGNALHAEVQQDGRAVGQISARINTDRLYRTLLGMTPRDREEIPFAVGADGQLTVPRSTDHDTVESLKLTSALPTEGTSVRSVNNWVVATTKDPSGATFGIARPLGDELRDLRRVSLRNFAAGFGLIVLVFVASIPLAGGMTRNLRTLMGAVQHLSAGDLSTRVEVRSRDEFGRLGSAFNQMAENLAAHEALVVKQERIRRELELCRLIQNEMLPHQPLRLRLAEVKGVSIPAREVGGDFFNYFVLPGGEVAVLVGDVSGKGVGAALLMANVQATLRARLPLEQDLAKLADGLDRDLEANTPIEVYSTLFVGIVDTARRELRYVNAGHNSQFVLRKQGGFERLASTGRPLGLIAGAGYEEVRLPLEDGDVLFFYTDGMLEAENEAGEFLGTERLEAALASSPGTDVDTILAHVEDAVRSFRGSAELFDDATMMALRFGANPPAQTLV
jgi:serine phosphatase RsbU (regulator of sigma subunit)